MSRVLFESPSARMRVRRAAEWLRARGEPHVLVVGASMEAAAEIAREALSADARASLGWQRTTLNALAATLARPELARRDLAPASALALEAICARVVHDHAGALGRLGPIADRPGLPRALARTLGELRLAHADGTRVTAAGLAPLLDAYEAELASARLVDRAGTLAIAAEVARARADLGPLLLVDVALRSVAERELCAAIAANAPAALAVLPRGDERAIELVASALDGCAREAHVPTADEGPLAPLHDGLFGAASHAEARMPDGAVTVLSAPGESRECVEIARLVLEEAARGTPLDRMAVLLRAPQYGSHLAEAFRRARVPAFFARGTRRPDPSGRAFLALLACAAEQLSARRFAEYLSLGEVPDEAEGGAPPVASAAERAIAPDDETLHGLVGAGAAAAAPPEPDVANDEPPVAEEDRAVALGTLRAPRHWERLLVEASVIGEVDRWRRRLAGLAAKLANDVAVYQAKDEVALAESSARELAALESLRKFALPLVEDLAALPLGGATWGTWIDRLGDLAGRALRHPDRVLAVLAELAPMARVDHVGIGEVRLVLEPRLSQLLVPAVGRRHGKLFVATTDEARGLAFDVVFVPGLAEKMFPRKVSEDPLLLDDARRRLSPDLPTNDDRTNDERLALRLAVGAASRRVVLSYPRVDVEQARPRTPSFYGLELLRVAEGKLGDFEHLASKAASTIDARIGWPAPLRREDAIDEAEYDLALLKDVLAKPADEVDGEGRYLVDANPHLARALRFRWMRWDAKDLRPSDGLVSPRPEALAAIHEHTTDKRSFSPTALQNFAACPYRFLLSAIHKLAPREEPEPLEDIDALTKGSLVHEVLYRLLTELRDERLLPVTAATLEPARERLDRVLREVADEFRDRLSPAIERVWQDSMTGIGADLREWLRRMVGEPDGFTPTHFELSFGLKDPRAQDARSTDEPVRLENGLLLRGSIDVVEESRGGAIRATDYKTGKVKAKKDVTVIGGGEILQPVLYALTIEKLFPGARIDSGVLYYCTSAGSFEKVRVPLDEEARDSAHLVAKTVSDALVKGFLPTAPKIEKKGYSACTWCDFRPVCGPYEEVRTQKKRVQARYKELAELRRRR